MIGLFSDCLPSEQATVEAELYAKTDQPVKGEDSGKKSMTKATSFSITAVDTIYGMSIDLRNGGFAKRRPSVFLPEKGGMSTWLYSKGRSRRR